MSDVRWFRSMSSCVYVCILITVVNMRNVFINSYNVIWWSSTVLAIVCGLPIHLKCWKLSNQVSMIFWGQIMFLQSTCIFMHYFSQTASLSISQLHTKVPVSKKHVSWTSHDIISNYCINSILDHPIMILTLKKVPSYEWRLEKVARHWCY